MFLLERILSRTLLLSRGNHNSSNSGLVVGRQEVYVIITSKNRGEISNVVVR